MRLASIVRHFAVLSSAGLALALAGSGGSLAKPEPAVIEAPPPPPMPGVELGDRFIRDAAAYETYVREAQAISPAFASGAQVSESLRVGVAYQPAEFQRGELAYAAIAALQDRAFVAAVRAAGQTPQQRYDIVRSIFADPANVLQFDDARGAAALARRALIEGGIQLLQAGHAVRQAAYDVQRQPWSRDDVLTPDQRLLDVKLLSTSPRSVTRQDLDPLESEVAGADPAADPETPDPAASATSAPPVAPAPIPASSSYLSPFVIRAVALAALGAIGQAGDDSADNLNWLSYDYFTEKCLGHAKNELNECLAVARPNYEDVFCLGQPAMIYTAECVVKGAGGYVPLEVATQPLAIPPIPGGRAPASVRRRHHG